MDSESALLMRMSPAEAPEPTPMLTEHETSQAKQMAPRVLVVRA
jgi:hypothetical protein